MTIKYITTYVGAGYTLAPQYAELKITATGGVGGTGVVSTHFATIINSGSINSSSRGIFLSKGGDVTNFGSISAVNLGIETYGAGSVSNLGFISGGIELESGVVTNGSATVTTARISSAYLNVSATTVNNWATIESGSDDPAVVASTIVNGGVGDTTALIEGVVGAYAFQSISNLGTIAGSAYGAGVEAGGGVTNGSLTDSTATIVGRVGVIASQGVPIINYGLIEGSRYTGIYEDTGTVSVLAVLNGAVGDTSARIQGVGGIQAYSFANVLNYGIIDGVPQAGAGMGPGVALTYGGVVHNGDEGDRVALIEGPTGIYAKSAYASISNMGTILGDYGGPGHTGALGDGIELLEGGAVFNGSADNTATLIKGAAGVDIQNLAGAVTNFGTILGDYGYGIALHGGGNVTNGSVADPAARVEGYGGIYFNSDGTVTNFGTVFAVYYEGHGDFGVDLTAASGGSLVNGASGDTAALIEGYVGVRVGAAAATLTNFGTIVGTSGVAVEFSSSTDVLVVEGGGGFMGAVLGDGATLDLDSGKGMLSGLISPAGDVMVSGSMAPTTFNDFATLEIGSAASFVTSGPVGLASGQAVIDFGALTIGGGKDPRGGKFVNGGLIEAVGSGSLAIVGPLANSGVLVVSGGLLEVTGAVSGSGHADIGGGTLDFLASFNQNVAFTGKGGMLELSQSRSYGGKISGFSGATLLDLADIGFVTPGEATFAGGKKSGVLTVTDGKNTARITLEGDYRNATFVAASDGHGGVFVEEKTQAPLPAIAAPAAFHRLIDLMASLGAPAAGANQLGAEPWRAGVSTLASPGVCFA